MPEIDGASRRIAGLSFWWRTEHLTHAEFLQQKREGRRGELSRCTVRQGAWFWRHDAQNDVR